MDQNRGEGVEVRGEGADDNSFLSLTSYPLPLFIAVSAAIAAIFIIFPQIDLQTSKLFYISGPKFYLANHIVFNSIRHVVEGLVVVFGLLWPGLLIVGSWSFIVDRIKNFRQTTNDKRPARLLWGLSRIRILYLILALVVGPGLVVNTIFKDNWGRARPSQIVMFGGTKKFTPPFVISNQCKVNCSFVSGDPSVGFYFFALALAIPARRRLFMFTAFALGGIFGITRIIQGGHFLSDVIFSGIFTFSVSYLLYLAMLKVESRLQKQ